MLNPIPPNTIIVSASVPSGGTSNLQLSAPDPPNPDTSLGLLTRELREDNAYTQELLGQLAGVLAKVFITPGILLAGATAAPSLAVVPCNGIGPGVVVNGWGSINTSLMPPITSNVAPQVSAFGGAVPVIAQSMAYPLFYPMHLYDSGTIGGAV